MTLKLTITGHTNAGKTALVRTLLRRDIGHVRDAPHVTATVETYEWIETPKGGIQLADTPGFDRTRRLAARLSRGQKPSGWLLREFWDRLVDPEFYLTQASLKHVAESTDVVLHIVDIAAEHEGPDLRTRSELEMLGFLNKPVILILNQTGRAWSHTEASTEEATWRRACANLPVVREILLLDAYSRSWLAELSLLHYVRRHVPEEMRETLDTAHALLAAGHLKVFEKSMRALVAMIAEMNDDGEAPGRLGFLGNAWRAAAQLFGGADNRRSLDRARKNLRNRMSQRTVQYVNTLIELHGIAGRGERREWPQDEFAFSGGAPWRMSWHLGATAVVVGALVGGLIGTFGEGLAIIGGAGIGAVAGLLVAIVHGARKLAEIEATQIVWRREAVLQTAVDGVRAYLAVSHFGRAQGSWRDHAGPDFWGAVIDGVVEPDRERLFEAIDGGSRRLEPTLTDITRTVLERLYPSAPWPVVETAAVAELNGAAEEESAPQSE